MHGARLWLDLDDLSSGGDGARLNQCAIALRGGCSARTGVTNSEGFGQRRA
jgi:hypothetical protein